MLPFEFTGRLLKVTVDVHADQKLDGDGVGFGGDGAAVAANPSCDRPYWIPRRSLSSGGASRRPGGGE
ncbi:hypothetical protein GWE18_03480 [Bradyrhizobium sp. CSA112]|uniref:hypothetical protein n=1 Tax=Bradyrhizobium sp. CSA112 TaxID=2699170 RepID=UPI0023AEABBE|nr:hypothetical protein [Bradyrhizobium sp. CSA112]MDE5451938.1 hypothetical protein [Bradyrhizobium sp. CSA112]